jgi:hypothetical protein
VKSVPQEAPRVRVLEETFHGATRNALLWKIGVLATSAATFDDTIPIEQSDGLLRIAPLRRAANAHFSGYVSTGSFDLRSFIFIAELARPAAGAETIFAVGIDADNWVGFRVADGQLHAENHARGVRSDKAIPYDSRHHRFLRLRRSNVAPVVVWETSADGRAWNPTRVETLTIPTTPLRIALSAGTSRSAESPGTAAFGSLVVEKKQP